MKKASFRFYAELNDFLPRKKRAGELQHAFRARVAVKDTIESLGVPHTEVDLILANGVSIDFNYLLRDGDRISVYPRFCSIDITPLLRVRPDALDQPRFVADTHLGRLARYLRMLGFDTLYGNQLEDELLAELSRGEGRILLTRDRGLLKRRMVTHGYCLRTHLPRQQLEEVIRRFNLAGSIRPFRHCMRCNGLLEEADIESVVEDLPEKTAQHYQHFHRCRDCRQIYWKGSHYERMRRWIEAIQAP